MILNQLQLEKDFFLVERLLLFNEGQTFLTTIEKFKVVKFLENDFDDS